MLESVKFFALRHLPRAVRKRRLFDFYERDIAGGGERELRALPTLVRAGDRCLDVGCNIGVYSYLLSKLGGHVTSFEPNPVMAKLVQELDLPDVEVRQIALSNADGEAQLSIPRVDSGHALASLRANAFEGDASTVTVPTRRLDGLALSPVDFIKVDVEGFEEHVIEGAVETILREQPVLLIEIEERHNAGGLVRLHDRFALIGYRGYYLTENGWQQFDGGEAERLSAVQPGAADYINNFLFLPTGRDVPGNA